MDTTTTGARGAPDLLTAVWRHKLLVALVTLGAAFAGWGLSHLQPTMYQGTARLVLNDPRSTSVFDESRQPVLDPARYVRNRAEYLTSSLVLARASELIGGRLEPGTIQERITAEPAKELDLVVVTARDPSPTGAADLANAVSQAYQDVVLAENKRTADATSRELDATRAQLQGRIDSADVALRAGDKGVDSAGLSAQRAAAAAQLQLLESRADQITVDAALYGSGVQLFEKAQPATSPSQPRPLGAALVAGFLGFLAALAMTWWRAEHRQNADSRQDAASVLGAPLLGEVPDFSTAGLTGVLPAHEAPNSVAGESYHFLIASLAFSLNDTGGKTILITSAGPSDGKTVTATNIAIAAMQDGRRVLMVDADERARGLTRLTGVPVEPGLTDVTSDAVPVAGVISEMRLSDDVSLPVVAAGRRLDDPAGFFRTSVFRRAVQRIKDEADLIIIDAPPLLAVSDTSAIAAQADGIVIVVKSGTPIRMLKEVRERLAFVGTPVLGYVFNRSDPRRGRSGYGQYGYGYGYGYGSEPAPKTSTLPRLRRRTKEPV